MANFLLDFPDDDLMDAISDEVVYHAVGGDYTIKCAVEYEDSIFQNDHGVDIFEGRVDLELLKTEIIGDDVKRGDTFSFDGDTFEMQHPVRTNNRYIRFVCKTITV